MGVNEFDDFKKYLICEDKYELRVELKTSFISKCLLNSFLNINNIIKY